MKPHPYINGAKHCFSLILTAPCVLAPSSQRRRRPEVVLRPRFSDAMPPFASPGRIYTLYSWCQHSPSFRRLGTIGIRQIASSDIFISYNLPPVAHFRSQFRYPLHVRETEKNSPWCCIPKKVTQMCYKSSSIITKCFKMFQENLDPSAKPHSNWFPKAVSSDLTPLYSPRYACIS
jgi:hypothetical protein